VVSTNWFGNGFFGGSATAGQYTLSGTPTGTSWNRTTPPAGETFAGFLDGTSDGTHNYTVDELNSNVIATDLNWQSPSILFPLSCDLSCLGITYDPSNNSIWVGKIDFAAGSIVGIIDDYTLSGTLLSGFTATGIPPDALAFDPADGTLWLSGDGINLLFQYSTSGVFLQSGTPTGLPQISYNAGEFSEAVPEPTALVLLGSGLLSLAMMRRRKLGRMFAFSLEVRKPPPYTIHPSSRALSLAAVQARAWNVNLRDGKSGSS
jgi:hypothetical protein